MANRPIRVRTSGVLPAKVCCPCCGIGLVVTEDNNMRTITETVDCACGEKIRIISRK